MLKWSRDILSANELEQVIADVSTDIGSTEIAGSYFCLKIADKIEESRCLRLTVWSASNQQVEIRGYC